MIMYPFHQQSPHYQGACRAKKSKYLSSNWEVFYTEIFKQVKKEYDFVSKIEWSQFTDEDIDKYLKNSPEEIKLLDDIYFHRKWIKNNLIESRNECDHIIIFF